MLLNTVRRIEKYILYSLTIRSRRSGSTDWIQIAACTIARVYASHKILISSLYTLHLVRSIQCLFLSPSINRPQLAPVNYSPSTSE